MFKSKHVKTTITALVILLVIFSGIMYSYLDNQSESTLLTNDEQREILADFEKKIQSKAAVTDLFSMLEDNINKLSPQNCTDMILLLEVYQTNIVDFHNNINNKLTSRALFDIYKGNIISSINVNLVENTPFYKEVKTALDSNFNLYYKSGEYRYMVNYSSYKKYSDYLVPDIKEYIDLMASECSNPSFMNGKTSISHSERFDRARYCADFISNYPHSDRFNVIDYRYNIYMTSLLMGGQIREIELDSPFISTEYKSFLDTVDLTDISNTAVKDLISFRKLIAKNDFKYSPEVKNYINEFLDKI